MLAHALWPQTQHHSNYLSAQSVLRQLLNTPHPLLQAAVQLGLACAQCAAEAKQMARQLAGSLLRQQQQQMPSDGAGEDGTHSEPPSKKRKKKKSGGLTEPQHVAAADEGGLQQGLLLLGLVYAGGSMLVFAGEALSAFARYLDITLSVVFPKSVTCAITPFLIKNAAESVLPCVRCR